MAGKEDINGYLLYEDRVISREGVFPYLGKQLGANNLIQHNLNPNEVYWVYRPASELSKPETIKSFQGAPVTNDHEMQGSKFKRNSTSPYREIPDANNQSISKGSLFNVYWSADGEMRGDIRIINEKLISDIKSGKKELSLGYNCKYVLEPGEFDGRRYQFVQRNIIGNHIAVVKMGRMGPSVSVEDSADTIDLNGLTAVYDKIDYEIMEKTQMKNKNRTEAADEFVKASTIAEYIRGHKGLNSDIQGEILGWLDSHKEKDRARDAAREDEDKSKTSDAAREDDRKKGEDEVADMRKTKDASREDEDEEKRAEKKMKRGEDRTLAYPFDDRNVNKAAEIVGGRAINVDSRQEKQVSMDEIEKEVRTRLYAAINMKNRLKPILNDFDPQDKMTYNEIVEYACDELNIPKSAEALDGYLAASERNKQPIYGIVEDSADGTDKYAATKHYINK